MLRWRTVNTRSSAPANSRLVMLAILLVLAGVYTTAASYHLHQVNTEILKADQRAYLAYARQMNVSQYGVVGGRNQMPVYPFLISLIDPGEVELDELFVRAKTMNVALSMLVLVGVYLLARRSIPGFEAFALTTIVAFTVFLYRSGYAQAELLYYGLFFLSFLLALSLLGEPRPGVAVMAGIVLGVSYLTKASVLPLLAAYVFWALVASAVSARSGEPSRTSLRAVATTLVVVLVFFATVFPYIQTSKQQFGRWFYNVNTSIYMWADSWDEVKEVMRGSGDREHWPDVPEELLPSPRRYFAEHSVGDIAARIAQGMWTSELRHLIEKPFGYGKYLIFYCVVALAVVVRAREKVVETCIANGRWVKTAFVMTVIAGYVVAYAFYSPIVRGPRLVLALYLPAMFSIFWLLTRKPIATISLWASETRELRLAHVHIAALAMLAIDLVFRMPTVIATAFAGA